MHMWGHPIWPYLHTVSVNVRGQQEALQVDSVPCDNRETNKNDRPNGDKQDGQTVSVICKPPA